MGAHASRTAKPPAFPIDRLELLARHDGESVEELISILWLTAANLAGEARFRSGDTYLIPESMQTSLDYLGISRWMGRLKGLRRDPALLAERVFPREPPIAQEGAGTIPAKHASKPDTSGRNVVFEDTDMGIQAATAVGMASVKVPRLWSVPAVPAREPANESAHPRRPELQKPPSEPVTTERIPRYVPK